MNIGKKTSEVLKKLVKVQNLNSLELSRRTGIAQPVVYRLITGETNNPKIATLCDIADYFEISLNQLIGESPLPDFDNPNSSTTTEIPLLTWEQSIIWPSLSTAKLNQTKKISVDLAPNPNLFALVVKDASMEPLFCKGTIIVIESTKQPKDQVYVIAKLDKNKTPLFRQLVVDDDFMYLKPLNPNTEKYKMKLFDKEKDCFYGTLVQARTDYDY